MNLTRYDQIAAHYDQVWPHLVPAYTFLLQAMVEVVASLDSTPKDLLDWGCGPGCAALAVAPFVRPDHHVTLLDGSNAMLALAQTALGRHHSTCLTDYADDPVRWRRFDGNSFDLVLCSFALHHLEDSRKNDIIAYLAKVLRPGGLLLLADEVVVDRPAGWPVVERIRSRIIEERRRSGAISAEYLALERQVPEEATLPLRPARIDDLVSWMARAGFGVSCPVNMFGSALLIGVKMTTLVSGTSS